MRHPPIGARVVVRDLPARPDLNERDGDVVCFMADTGRFLVEMNSTGETIALLPQNLFQKTERGRTTTEIDRETETEQSQPTSSRVARAASEQQGQLFFWAAVVILGAVLFSGGIPSLGSLCDLNASFCIRAAALGLIVWQLGGGTGDGWSGGELWRRLQRMNIWEMLMLTNLIEHLLRHFHGRRR